MTSPHQSTNGHLAGLLAPEPAVHALPASTSRELTASELCARCDPSRLPFETTAQLEPLAARVGQQRAVEALQFGVAMRGEGYNLYAMGRADAGKHTAVRSLLQQRAASEPTPSDVCYVVDFARPHEPRLLLLPPGKGAELRRDVAQLVDEVGTAIPHALESDEYRARRQAIADDLKERHEHAFEALRTRAEENHLAILQTPLGLALAPVKSGDVVPPDAFEKLPQEERETFQKAIAEIEQELRHHVEEEPRWQHEARRKLKDLVHGTVRAAVGHLVDDLKAKYAAYPEVVHHLTALGNEVVEHGSEFVKEGDDSSAPSMLAGPDETMAHARYLVNLLVDRAGMRGAPVVYEDHPTVDNLVGRVEHRSQMGMLVADLHLIKPGALHRANGGYLLLDARNLLLQPYAWEALKRALLARQLRIESLGQMMSLISTASLEPVPVPLDVKVVLLGERKLFYLLDEFDPDFRALFKVAVDFEDDVERTSENDVLYARVMASITREESLRPLDRGAVARVLDRCARLAGDRGKLTATTGPLVDLLREADHFAGLRASQAVSGEDVGAALAAQELRAGRVRERVLEQIRDGTLIIETVGARAGQVNGLSVVELGRSSFGYPTRITARVRLGQGRVVDIEREVELGGPIHSKGVMILAGLLAARYATGHPLSLSATLVFEQSYGSVEGDSASAAELFALLSALAEVPLAQSIAVTGSVNQHGDVQPVGGVNEKIEGFFDVCSARGLTGIQGVIVPASNARHLMLREDVVGAVGRAQFHVWPIRTIDEGIELVTGMPSGERGADGVFPRGTFNAMVEERLLAFARSREALPRGHDAR